MIEQTEEREYTIEVPLSSVTITVEGENPQWAVDLAPKMEGWLRYLLFRYLQHDKPYGDYVEGFYVFVENHFPKYAEGLPKEAP